MGIEVILGAVAAAAAVGGAVSQQQAASQQKKSIAAQQRSANVEAQRQRVAAAREARIRRAEILASAGAQGMGGATSGVAGAVSSVQAQLGGNIGYIGQQQTFAAEASAANQKAANAMSRGATWQAIGGVSGAAFDQLGGWAKVLGANTFTNAFPGTQPAAPIIDKSR